MLKTGLVDIALAMDSIDHKVALIGRIAEWARQTKPNVKLRSNGQNCVHACDTTVTPRRLDRLAGNGHLKLSIAVFNYCFQFVEFLDELKPIP